MSKGVVCFTVDRDGWTDSLQLSIGDDDGGYRLAGPKYNGSSKSLLRRPLTARDCNELEAYIKQAREAIALSERSSK